jgi:segregation and condensation protein B
MTIQENGQPLSMTAIVESLLFVADGPVSVKQLADTIQCERIEVEMALENLQQECLQRGIRLQRLGDRFQLVTSPDVSELVERFLGLSLSGKLSTAALEALAIIAYRQPITRPEIDAIRGVNSDGVLRTLVSKGLVEEVGRLETVGHPVLYGTSFQFLQYFGLGSLAELPTLPLEGTADSSATEPIGEVGAVEEPQG